MEKKYLLRKDLVKTFRKRTLYRIEALRDFGGVKKGDLGGWIQSEDNLSHEGTCWIYNNAKAFDLSSVTNDAMLLDNSMAYGKSRIYGNALLEDHATASGRSSIGDHATLANYSKAYGNSTIYDQVELRHHSRAFGNAVLSHSVRLFDHSKVYGKSKLKHTVALFGHADVKDSTLWDTVVVKDSTIFSIILSGNAHIQGDVFIHNNMDLMVLKAPWGLGAHLTYIRPSKMWSMRGRLLTSDELIARAKLVNPIIEREYKRLVEYVESVYHDLEYDKGPGYYLDHLEDIQ